MVLLRRNRGEVRDRWRRRAVELADEHPEVAAIVVGVARGMRVAGGAAAQLVGRRRAAVVGNPVALRVGVGRLSRVTRAEEHGGDSCSLEGCRVRQEVFSAVVLVVAVRVVHRQVVLVANGHLPDDQRACRLQMQLGHPLQPDRKVRQLHVLAVPPMRPAVTGDQLEPSCVVVGDVVEDQVEGAAPGVGRDPGGVEKGGDLVGFNAWTP